MATHHLPEGAIHFSWSDDMTPALTISPGDEVVVRTRDSSDNLLASSAQYPAGHVFKGHPMAGPIAVAGVAAGECVQVDILEINTGPYGFTLVRPGLGLLGDAVEQPYVHHWAIKEEAAEFMPGVSVPLQPILGIVGLAPANAAPSTAPHAGGGNLDFRDLTAGSSLFLQAQRPLGYLSIGDAHQSQADGEACGTAIETSCRARIRVTRAPGQDGITFVRKRAPLLTSNPAWGALGVGTDFRAAARTALMNVISILRRHLGLDFARAYVLAGNAFDLRVVEAVNGGVLVVAAEIRDGVNGIFPPAVR